MRKLYFAILSLAICFITQKESIAQTCIGATIQVSTTTSPSTPSITFSWATITGSTGITIYRKTKAAMTWGTALATLAGTATTYTDNTVVVGTAYEYRLTSAGTQTANTYFYSGIQVPQVDKRGKVILLVDNTFTTTLATELTRLESDLTGDGWQVIRHDVSRSALPADVKALIKTDYTADPTNVKTVFVFGHIPVPYSGNLNPDGHADHKGAWPADGYYADMTGSWTDATVNNTTATRVENDNIPGDGKFDQNYLPNTLELQIGRVDMCNLTSFTSTEEQLLKKYLNKDHAFRHKYFNPRRKSLIDDNFGMYGGEGFASSGWRNFTAMFNPTDIKAGDFFTDMTNQSYMWSYGCGAGNYTGAGGVGSTNDFATKSPQSVFTMLFGSYFGDWDCPNAFMRAALASDGWGLTCSWSGRPFSIYHHMALGDNIGYSAWITMRNTGVYVYNYAPQYTTINLMGDPTLRMHIVSPPSNVAVAGTNPKTITWKTSTETVLGYHVYRQNNGTGTFEKITSSIVTGNTFSDVSPVSVSDAYMVRAIVLETSNSGSYYNLSQGAFSGQIIDATAPTAPTSLASSLITDKSVKLTWTAATDNIGVVGYEVYTNGVFAEKTINPSINLFGLAAGTIYSITVKARDAAGNLSTASSSINVSTLNWGILMDWDFYAQGGKASVATSDVMNGISSTAPSGVATTGPVFTANAYNANGLSMSNQKKATLAEAITANEYITFKIAPVAGISLSIDSLKLEVFSQNQPRNFTLMSDVAGFTAGSEIGTTSVSKNIKVTNHNNKSSVIEFRVYVWGPTNQYEGFGLTDLVVYGSMNNSGSTYTLSVTNGTGGGTYASGTSVNIAANTPAAGKVFDKWTGATTGIANVNSASTTITMPAANAALTATYKDITYLLTVTSGTGGGSFAAGTVVNITANAPAAGKVFDKWTGATTGIADVNLASTTITMPAANAALTATYKDITYTLTVTGGTGGGSFASGTVVAIAANAPAVGKVFDKWIGATTGIANLNSASTTIIMPSANTIITATYKTAPVNTFTLIVVNGTGNGNYTAGTVVSISANAPALGKVFDKWTGVATGIANMNFTSTTLLMPASNVTITANYKEAIELEESEIPTIEFYPNPVRDYMYFNQVGIVSVYDMNGILLLQKNVTSVDAQVNVSNLSSGFYIIKVSNQEVSITKTFIKE